MENYSFPSRSLDLGGTLLSPDVSSSFNHHGFTMSFLIRDKSLNVESVFDKSSRGKEGGK
jgi:hypothetical protein